MDYNKQAEDFLRDTGTTLEIVKAEPQKAPLWAREIGQSMNYKGPKKYEHGINYTVTLSNSRHKYTFDFWDSIRDREIIEAIEAFKKNSFAHDSSHYQAEKVLKEHNIPIYRARNDKENLIKEYMPSSYDILACLSLLDEDTFEDFCSSFGYDTDSIKAEKTYQACIEQDRQLRKLFSDSQLELLAEIN